MGTSCLSQTLLFLTLNGEAGSAIVRGRAASSRGPSVVPSAPFAALDRTLMASLTAGDNTEHRETAARLKMTHEEFQYV
ncbi:hypothetical protein CapIbe_003301 [Capra ibex]